jgi:hypothetical protein
LRDRFNSRQSVSSDVQNVLDRAAFIDGFMRRNRLSGQVNSDWASLRTDLNQLASIYSVTWNWNTQTSPSSDYPTSNYPQNDGPRGGRAASRLTGTYSLDAARSARRAASLSETGRGVLIL